MIDSGGKSALRWLEGVVCRKVNVKEEHSAGEGAIIGPHNGGLPVVTVFLVDGAG